MLEAIILGTIQGIVEWLPVSSEGMLVLAKVNIFGGGELEEILRMALFLHLGTFFAALIYFRKDVTRLLKSITEYKDTDTETKKILWFLVIATVISGAIGLVFLELLEDVEITSGITNFINVAIALLLVITGILQLKSQKDGLRSAQNIKNSDSVLLGFVQGFAALPGLSRSGLTVSTLLLRKFQDTESLRLSFLLSLPLVFLGNIALNLNEAALTAYNLIALLFAFVFGYLTIHLLLKLARKINFGYFVLIFAALLIVSVFI